MNTKNSRAFAFAPLALGLAAIALAQPTDPAASAQDGQTSTPTWAALQRVEPAAPGSTPPPIPRTPVPQSPVTGPRAAPGNLAGTVFNSFPATVGKPGAVAVGRLPRIFQDRKALQELEQLRSEIDVLRAERETMLRALEQSEPRNRRAPESESGTEFLKYAGDQFVGRVTLQDPEADFFVGRTNRSAPAVDFLRGLSGGSGGAADAGSQEIEVEVRVLDPRTSTDPEAHRALRGWVNGGAGTWIDAAQGQKRTVYVVPSNPTEPPPGVSGLHAPRWRVLEQFDEDSVQQQRDLVATYMAEAEQLAAEGSLHAHNAREQAEKVQHLIEQQLEGHHQTLRIEAEQADSGGTGTHSWYVVVDPHTGEPQVLPAEARTRVLLGEDSDGQSYEFHVIEENEEQAAPQSSRGIFDHASGRAILELHLGELEGARAELGRVAEHLGSHDLEAKLAQIHEAEGLIELQLSELEALPLRFNDRLRLEVDGTDWDLRAEIIEVHGADADLRADLLEQEHELHRHLSELALHEEHAVYAQAIALEAQARELAQHQEHVNGARAEALQAEARAIQGQQRALNERAVAERTRELVRGQRTSEHERGAEREYAQHEHEYERDVELQAHELEREFNRQARDFEREAERLDEHLVIELHENLRRAHGTEEFEQQIESLQAHIEALEDAHGELGNDRHALQVLLESAGWNVPRVELEAFPHDVFEDGVFEFWSTDHDTAAQGHEEHHSDARTHSAPAPYHTPDPQPRSVPHHDAAQAPQTIEHIEDVEIQIHHHNGADAAPAHGEMLDLLHEIRDELRSMRGEMRDLRSSVQSDGRVGQMRAGDWLQVPDEPISALEPVEPRSNPFLPAGELSGESEPRLDPFPMGDGADDSPEELGFPFTGC